MAPVIELLGGGFMNILHMVSVFLKHVKGHRRQKARKELRQTFERYDKYRCSIGCKHTLCKTLFKTLIRSVLSWSLLKISCQTPPEHAHHLNL